jgi:hypothetical protein
MLVTWAMGQGRTKQEGLGDSDHHDLKSVCIAGRLTGAPPHQHPVSETPHSIAAGKQLPAGALDRVQDCKTSCLIFSSSRHI